MANDLNGFLVAYANESLPQLIATSPMLAFTTDFSAELASGGTSVVTRIPSTTYTLNDTHANGYVALAASSSAVTVTLKQRDVTHAFSELEWQNAPQIYNTFVPSMTKALVNGVVNDMLSVVTLANFATSMSSSAAGFSGSAVAKAAQLLSTNNVPNEDRCIIVPPTYKETLVNSVNQAYFLNPTATTSQYAGLSVYEYNNIPTTDSLKAFAAHKSAIAIASRIPSFGGNVEQVVMTDPSSGLSIAFRQWHSADDGKWKLAASLIYGTAKGNGSSLVRIVA